MKKIVFFIIAICLFISCKSREKKTEVATFDEVMVVESPADDWGSTQTNEYEGVIPGPDGHGIRYNLTISKREHQSNGNYVLITTFLNSDNGQDQSLTSRGKFHIIRGTAENENATVYKLVDEIDDETFHFMAIGKDKLRLLNDRLEEINKNPDINFDIVLVENEKDSGY